MISRRFFLTVLAALPAPALVRAQASGPIGPIQTLNQALLQAMQAGKRTPFPQRYNMLAPVIDQVLDLAAILQTSVGLAWSQLPPAQQSSLSQVFRTYTICSYAANFDSYDGQRFTVSPDTRSVGTEQVVTTQIIGRSSTNRIDYVMRSAGGGWRAVDVLLDGSISRVAVQRSDFRRLLSGGSADPLIRSLQSKVQQLSGGTVTS
jgi:phospholipid transport system substrate-binding protein